MKKLNLIILLPLLLTSQHASAILTFTRALMVGTIPVITGAAVHYHRSYIAHKDDITREHDTLSPYGNGAIRGLVAPVVGNTMLSEFRKVAGLYSDNLDRITDHKKPYDPQVSSTTFVKEEAKVQGFVLGAAVWPLTALRLLTRIAKR